MNPNTMKKFLFILCLLPVVALSETMPQKPTKYFTDNAGIVTQPQASAMNEQLAQFERETSNQFVVAVYPAMLTESTVEDYTQRIAQSWGVGQKDKRNGLALFVFMTSPEGKGKIYLQVGYGLEGAVPDITAKSITRHMAQYFKRKMFDEGLSVGINETIAAAKDEHKGTGVTKAESGKDFNLGPVLWGIGILIFLVLAGIGIGAYIIKRRDNKELDRQRRNYKDYIITPSTPSKRYVTTSPRVVPSKKRRESYEGVSPYVAAAASSYSSSDSSSSSSSDSSSSFSSGGGDFGGGGGGSDF